MWHPNKCLPGTMGQTRHMFDMNRSPRSGANASPLGSLDPLTFIRGMSASFFGVTDPVGTARNQRASGPGAYLLRDTSGIL